MLNLTLKITINHPKKTIGILTKVFNTYGPNLVILAWTGDELSRGQTWWRTDRQTQAMTIPGSQNWPRVKLMKIPRIGMIYQLYALQMSFYC